MERERLDLLLKDPSLVNAGDLPALRELVDRNPWFSGAHLLLAAGEQAGGDVLSGSTVQRAAVQIPSRQVLFDLVHAAPARDTRRTTTIPASAIEEPPSQNRTTTPPEAEAPDEPEDDLTTVPSTQGPIREEPVLEVPDDELSGQYEEAILAGGYLLSPEEPSAEIDPSEEVAGQDPGTGLPEEPIQAVGAPEEAAPPIVVSGTRMRFSDWLDTPSVPAAAAASASTRAASTAREEAPVKDLIDRFIQSQTPPPTPKATFYKPQEAAKRSLADEAGLVTETLAKLYAAQGNTSKAIDAYDRLALKHPEKSSYFAALAKALEDKTSN